MAETCRSCKAPITWALSEKGKRIPMDAEPVPDGNFILHHHRGPGEPPTARPIGDDHVPGPQGPLGFKSHFATCPDAGKWRRR